MPELLPFPAQIPSTDPTVREVIGWYLSIEAKANTRVRGKRAWLERERVLTRFADAHGTLRVSQCRKAILKIWIEGNPRLTSDWTRGRWCRTVQRAFNWALDEMDLIEKNPFRGVSYGKGKRGRPLTDGEFDALLAAAGSVFAPVLRFCRLTGCRPGEMAAARWEDVQGDLNAGRAWIVLKEHKTSDTSDGKPRVIALGPPAIELLAEIRRGLGCFPGMEPEFIFTNSRRKGWTRNAIGLRWANLRKQLQLPADAKLYGLRHRFATQAIVNGVGIKDLAELLGHTTTRMTEHYLHLAGQHERLCDLAGKATGGPSAQRSESASTLSPIAPEARP